MVNGQAGPARGWQTVDSGRDQAGIALKRWQAIGSFLRKCISSNKLYHW